jgi:MFS family permease
MEASSKQGERRRLRLARIAVVTFFFLNGVMTATLSTRLPAIQTKLALPPGQLGLALLGCTVGGLIAMNIAGRMSRRFGSNVITTTAAICMGIALLLIAFAPTLPLLILALVFFGAGSGAMDITMNIQGSDVERGYGRPIFNSFHACFSVGSGVSAFIGSTLAALNVSPESHFLAIVVCACVGIVWSSRFLLPSGPVPDVPRRQTQNVFSLRFSRTLMLLGVIAFCTLLSVGAMFDWSAVYLSGILHTGAGLAAAGFATFLWCMAFGRGVGDSLATRFGAAVLVRSACLLAATGLALALASAWTPVVLFGLGLVGIGLSVPFPLVVSAAGCFSEQDPGSALATITTWGYVGILAGPPVIGFVADREGLRLALTPVVFLCVLAALCVPVMSTAMGKRMRETLEDRKPLMP